MDRPRWEILVLAAAILVGALAIGFSMRANRYYYTDIGLLDSHTGEVCFNGGNDDWVTKRKPVE